MTFALQTLRSWMYSSFGGAVPSFIAKVGRVWLFRICNLHFFHFGTIPNGVKKCLEGEMGCTDFDLLPG